MDGGRRLNVEAPAWVLHDECGRPAVQLTCQHELLLIAARERGRRDTAARRPHVERSEQVPRLLAHATPRPSGRAVCPRPATLRSRRGETPARGRPAGDPRARTRLPPAPQVAFHSPSLSPLLSPVSPLATKSPGDCSQELVLALALALTAAIPTISPPRTANDTSGSGDPSSVSEADPIGHDYRRARRPILGRGGILGCFSNHDVCRVPDWQWRPAGRPQHGGGETRLRRAGRRHRQHGPPLPQHRDVVRDRLRASRSLWVMRTTARSPVAKCRSQRNSSAADAGASTAVGSSRMRSRALRGERLDDLETLLRFDRQPGHRGRRIEY